VLIEKGWMGIDANDAGFYGPTNRPRSSALLLSAELKRALIEEAGLSPNRGRFADPLSPGTRQGAIRCRERLGALLFPRSRMKPDDEQIFGHQEVYLNQGFDPYV
jgi:hypothetical protein